MEPPVPNKNLGFRAEGNPKETPVPLGKMDDFKAPTPGVMLLAATIHQFGKNRVR